MNSSVKMCLALILNVLAIELCLCHPKGAPTSVCHDLVPQHGAQAQSSQSPYTLSTRPANASHLILVIEGSESSPIRGFAIQARRVNASHEAIGKFVVNDSNAHTINCYNQQENTITHSNRKDKKKVEVYWMVPNEMSADTPVVFVGTVVKTAATFWTDLSSSPVKVGTNLSAGEGGQNYGTDEKKDHNSRTVHSSCANKSMDYLLVSAIFILFYRKI